MENDVQIQKTKRSSEVEATPKSPLAMGLPNNASGTSVNVATQPNNSGHRRSTLSTQADATSIALLNASTRSLLALVPGETRTAIPPAGSPETSANGLELEVGSNPGCLQVLEDGMNPEIESVTAENEANELFEARDGSRLEEDIEGNGASDRDFESDGSEAGEKGIGECAQEPRKEARNLRSHTSTGHSRRTTAPDKQARARDDCNNASSIAHVPSKRFFDDNAAGQVKRRKTHQRRQGNPSSTRISAKPKKGTKKTSRR